MSMNHYFAVAVVTIMVSLCAVIGIQHSQQPAPAPSVGDMHQLCENLAKSYAVTPDSPCGLLLAQ